MLQRCSRNRHYGTGACTRRERREGTYDASANSNRDTKGLQLIEISKMSSDRLNGIPASGHTHMFDMSSPDVRRSTATHDDIKLRSLAGSAGQTRSDFAPVQVMSIG